MSNITCANELSDIIEAAGFDEYDRDIGTAGLCGTFALAMKQVFPDLSLGLIVLNDKNGQPATYRGGKYYWRHAVAICEGELFDIYGRVLLEHTVENYCWGNIRGKGGCLVTVTEEDMRRHLKDERGSFDARRYKMWSEALAAAKNRLSLSPETKLNEATV